MLRIVENTSSWNTLMAKWFTFVALLQKGTKPIRITHCFEILGKEKQGGQANYSD